jgi:hypothetical protein
MPVLCRRRLVTQSVGLFVFLGLLAGGPAAPAEDRIHVVRAVVVEPGQTTGGDLIGFFCNVRIRGTAAQDVIVIGGSVDVEGTARDDVIVIGGAIYARRGSTLENDAIAIGGPVARDEGATIRGESVARPYSHLPGQREVFVRGGVALAALCVFVALFGYALVRARRSQRIAAALRFRPVASLLWGLGILALAVVLLNASEKWEFTEEAGPPLVLLGVAVVCAPGYVGLCWWGGGLSGRTGGFARVLLGALACALLLLLPLAGFLVMWLILALAAGAVALSRFGRRDFAPAPPA